jgi:excisionase family DNA binding protein
MEELKAKPFLSVAEACTLLGISRRTIYRMLERGELRAGKAGKRTIFQRSEIDKLFL